MKKILGFVLAVIGGTWLFKKTSEVYDNRKDYKQKIDNTKEIWVDKN